MASLGCRRFSSNVPRSPARTSSERSSPAVAIAPTSRHTPSRIVSPPFPRYSLAFSTSATSVVSRATIARWASAAMKPSARGPGPKRSTPPRSSARPRRAPWRTSRAAWSARAASLAATPATTAGSGSARRRRARPWALSSRSAFSQCWSLTSVRWATIAAR